MPKLPKELPAKRPGGRSARVRRAVFDATLTLLAEHDRHPFTIEAVARLAGVNKTTLYRNWASKTALILAAAEDRSENIIANQPTGNVEEDLVAFLTSVAASITSPLGRALIISTMEQSDHEDVLRARDAFWKHRFEAAADLVREALPGRLTPAEVDRFIESLIGPLYLRVFVTGAPVDAAYIRTLVRYALRAAST
jgi:AcrR family transcriptional regulator